MKVWELMAKLAECRAGADVDISTLVTITGLLDEGEFDKNKDGKSRYHVQDTVTEVSDDGNIVLLIADY